MAKTYDPKLVTIRIGPYLIDGFADGTFIKINRDDDNYKKQVGADGEVVRVRTNNKSGTGELTLLQSSKSNDDLSALALLDEQANSGIVPFLMKDDSGRTLAESVDCWVKKPADIQRGKEQNNVVWQLDFGKLTSFVGGH